MGLYVGRRPGNYRMYLFVVPRSQLSEILLQSSSDTCPPLEFRSHYGDEPFSPDGIFSPTLTWEEDFRWMDGKEECVDQFTTGFEECVDKFTTGVRVGPLCFYSVKKVNGTSDLV